MAFGVQGGIADVHDGMKGAIMPQINRRVQIRVRELEGGGSFKTWQRQPSTGFNCILPALRILGHDHDRISYYEGELRHLFPFCKHHLTVTLTGLSIRCSVIF